MELTVTAQKLTEDLRQGNRRALSKAITLAESHRLADRQLIEQVLSSSHGKEFPSFRLAVSGPPGVGKSTFIDALGEAIANKTRLAVLTIDPSSPVSGGSILGDRTRMEKLSSRQDVYVRPSPSGRDSGGIHKHTADTIALCELAGFDFIIIETVGVGQSETMAHNLSDHFLLLLNAGGGDELQGIKRGIMELADSFLFTKEDNIPGRILKRSMTDLRTAMHLLRPELDPESSIGSVSAIEKESLQKFAGKFIPELISMIGSEPWRERRKNQRIGRFRNLFTSELQRRLMSKKEATHLMTEIERQVASGTVALHWAVHNLLDQLLGSEDKS